MSVQAPAHTMTAFVMEGLGKVGYAKKPIPKPGPDDAIIKTTKALICTSDAHTVHGAIGERQNLTLGHEAVGIVHEVGSNVHDFRAGERVVVGAITPDWFDLNSQNGHPSQSGGLLAGWKFANVKDGVFAEYFHVNQADANMAHIPDDIPDEAAVYCCDMMSTGFMGAENGNIPIGGTVAVFGCGPVGLMAVAGSKLRGAAQIIAVETVPARQELARFYGATHVVDFKQEDPVERILALTQGRGADTAIEALGSDITFQNCVRSTRPGGTISNSGYHGSGEFVHLPREAWGVGMGEKTIATGLCPGGRLRMERLLAVLRAGLDVTRMTTHTFPFDRMPDAFRLMESKGDNILKPLIVFE